MRIAGILLLLFAGLEARAVGYAFDANVFYLNDAFSYNSQNNTYNRTLWEIAPMIALEKRGGWLVGVSYGSMGFADAPNGTTNTLDVSDIGLRVSYFIDSDRSWSGSFAYNFLSTGRYTTTGATVDLRGTSMKGEFGYTPEFYPGILIGAKFNYYQVTFSEKVVSGTLTKVPTSRTAIYPTFSLTIRFD